MRMTVLQHVEFEGPAAVVDWAAGREFPFRVFHLYRDTALPSLSDFDMLTVTGGPMSANDEARLGWLGPGIALVREAIARSKITKAQAFAIGQRVLGLQFHLEATVESVRALLKSAAHEVGPGVFEQQPATILASLSQCASLRPLLDIVLTG